MVCCHIFHDNAYNIHSNKNKFLFIAVKRLKLLKNWTVYALPKNVELSIIGTHNDIASTMTLAMHWHHTITGVAPASASALNLHMLPALLCSFLRLLHM